MIVYVAGPYTRGDVAQNVARAIEAAHEVIESGHAPYVPHLSHFLHLHKQRDYETWMRIDLQLLSRCDCMIRLVGESPGADREQQCAKELRIPLVLQTERGWQYGDETYTRLLSALNHVMMDEIAKSLHNRRLTC